MENLMNQNSKKQITQSNNKLSDLVKDLSTNLTSLQPKSETAQLITYALLATAVVGICVYHYIKDQERNPSTFYKD
jgi:hypothetical protein